MADRCRATRHCVYEQHRREARALARGEEPREIEFWVRPGFSRVVYVMAHDPSLPPDLVRYAPDRPGWRDLYAHQLRELGAAIVRGECTAFVLREAGDPYALR